jgi:hypothetical protein
MARKKLSGAQWRARKKAGEPAGKQGRPKGAKTRAQDPPPNILRWFRGPSWFTAKPPTQVDAYQLQLRRDLSEIGLPDTKIAKLVNIVRELDEYRGAYRHLSDRTLRREIAKIQAKIFGQKIRP